MVGRGSTPACGRHCPRAGSPLCLPLLRGRYPTSSLVWRHPTSSGVSGFLPVCRLCHPTPVLGRPQRISRVPDAALVTCHGLRPRWTRRSHGRLGSLDMAFREHNHVGVHCFVSITGLNPITLAHCSPSPPCVRFAASVTDGDATLGTRCFGQGFRGRVLPPADNAELCSAHYVRSTCLCPIRHKHGYLARQIMPRTMSKPRSGARLSACTAA